jgi:peroxiredoxin
MLVVGEGQKDIKVNAEGKRNGNVEIIGSEDSQKLLGYDIFRNDSNKRLIRPAYDAMRAATEAGDTKGEVEAVLAYSKASNDHGKELIDYTKDNIGTSLALYGTMLRWTGDDEVSKLENLVSDFEKVHPNLKMTKVMKDKVARYKKVAIGAVAPEFTLPDTAGNSLNINDLKGEYTLLDFWASWCSPCLLQVPDLKEAYDVYHDKGFEIVGVSVDSKGDRWKKAIEKYEMNWPHVSDLKGWGSETASDYNVTFIPFNMLIDSEGKIIAKNLHSKELQSKLAELFSEG